MLEITNEDILYAEKLLLNTGEVFDDERREIIKSLSSTDIKACPGSGKTTTLLAKLAILSRKLPLKDNSGICVLTHTNVAINEIKHRLGDYGQDLFDYPNNCSTIQSFVNQFLAIPSYIHFYGKRPIRIDDEIYNEVIRKKYYELIPRNLRFGIERQGLDITSIRFDLREPILLKNLYGNKVYKNQQSDSYIALKRLKESIMEDGVLCYDDAYFLAYKYITVHPEIKNIFSKCFSYVFIDEMQDTMTHQKELLDCLFDESVIVQRIGDLNQSIYDQSNVAGSWDIDNESCLQISDSKRFSNAIASIVQNICVSPQELIGNPTIPNIRPCLLVFNSESIGNVLAHFSRIIIKNELHYLDKKVFKAVGWVTEHQEKLGITSYCDSFNKVIKKKIDFDYLKTYLMKESSEDVERSGSDLYRKKILRGILKALREMGEKIDGKYYTELSFLNHLQKNNKKIYEELLLKLAAWCLKIHNDEDIISEVKSFITTDLRRFFNWGNMNILESFFINEIEGLTEAHQIQTNIFTYNESGNEVNVEVSSIHSVKGETHTATLYLETFYHDFDIKRIINYLKGRHTDTKATRTLQNLRMAYVGMTRPTHLLCIAVREETISKHEDELRDAGWDIEYVFIGAGRDVQPV
ncbi:UvrD-helicase domain-containing protein [Bacillus sp. PK3_68]|uniref:UvrD-helicase domain-containing protein n=1 Tax=Bacillus sp. PK3_68 TaxID=2027408 RepID=UPI0016024C69|nr:UvrD-helicase domain-containing protein [Bacillus sp. PK3_68]